MVKVAGCAEVEKLNRESKKSCGYCVFFLAFDGINDYGWCYKSKSAENHLEVLCTDKSCNEWLDNNVRYPSALKYITDERTLKWLGIVINKAYCNRVGLIGGNEE